MMDIRDIRERPDAYKKAVVDKGLTGKVDIDELLSFDGQRRELLSSSEELRAQRNELSSSIPKLSKEERPAVIAQVKEIKALIAEQEGSLQAVQESYNALMLKVPTVPADDVPIGVDENDNVLVRTWGTPREFDFEPKDHEELGELLGILDKPRAAKFAGGRSYLLKGAGALLELAAMRLALDVVYETGFTPVLGPLMVNAMALEGSGFFPYGKEDVYHIEKDDKWLIGTSEVHLVAIHADEILDESELPIKMAGHSACFRREAGSHGRDARGVYRVHQFSKVEQVVLCRANLEESNALHDLMLNNSEEVLRRLKLPHRVMNTCTGDMGQGKYRANEVETWMASREQYSETHSCSSLLDFQSRRLGIRYRDEEGKVQYCYTLNNTAVASPRILIPILEHYQNADGSVDVPEALQPYMYGLTRLEPKG